MIHWKVPTTIVGALILGIATAVGHHFFYNALDGRVVGGIYYDQSTTRAVGTALAFLVRFLLVLAISGTYWQVFWSRLHDRPMTMRNIDSLHGLLSKLYLFFNLSAMRTSPMLACLALLTWIMPFAAILPPATLSIQSKSFPNSSDTILQEPAFEDAPFAIISGEYQGPSRDLLRLALGTAYQGSLPATPPPAENATYSLDFYGPTTECLPATRDLIPQLEEACGGCEDVLWQCGNSYYFYNYFYWSWVPEDNVSEVPFNAQNPDGPYQSMSPVASYGGSPIEIFVATKSWDGKFLRDWVVLNCSLHNASYSATFGFTGRDQQVNLTARQKLNPIYPTDLWDGDQLKRPGSSYLAMMDLLGKVLIGSIWGDSTEDYYETDRTNVLETYLAYTRELVPVFETVEKQDDFKGVGNWTLADAIPELFTNMTLSLFASHYWVKNQSTTTKIRTEEYANIYNYKWQRLVLTYSIAIISASLAVIVGLITILKDRNSYSNKFSTIVRTTRSEELDALIDHHDRVGADPLADRLRQAKVWVGNASSSSYHVVNPDSELQRLNYHADSEALSMKSGISYVSRC